MDNSDLIVQFCNITSADPVQAESYLKVSDYNVEQAIELFFETGGMDLAATAPTNPPPPPPQAERRPEPPDVVDVDNFPSDAQETGAAAHDIDQDEALARRLMQEDIDSSGSGNGNNDGVRSPIAARQDILVHPDMDYNQSYRYASRGRGSSSRGIFNQAAPSIWNESDVPSSLAEATGGLSQANDKANRLAQMYRRPFEIMHRVSLEEARDTVRSEEPMKWIMVNIMNSQEFSCQILNRDLWSDKDVQKTIRENFYFLQYTSDEPDGLRYQLNYPFDRHPHIGIIDPRTGEQVKTWNEIIQPREFIFELHEFLGRFSLSEQALNPIAPKKVIKKDVAMMTEEEQMEAALAASLGKNISTESPQTSRPSSSQPQASDATTPGHFEEQNLPVGSPPPEKSPSLFASIPFSDTAEPAQSPQTTRIQFRFPEGGRPLVRRFNKTDTIRDVFAFVKGLRSDGCDFDLVFVGRRLLAEAEENGAGYLDRSIIEAGLANGSLTVEV